MNEEVTIKELLDLPEKFFRGQSEISLEGKIKAVLEPREVSGTKDGRSYHFWSQFLVIDDGTGEMGVDWTVGNQEEAIALSAKGKEVKVSDAKTDVYEKEGKSIRKLTRAKIELISGTSSTEIPEQSRYGQVPREVWEKKDKIITRTALAKSFIESGKEWCAGTKIEADFWFGWIFEKDSEDNSIEKVEKIENKKEKSKKEEEEDKRNRIGEGEKNKSNFEEITGKRFDRAKIRKNILAFFVEGHKLGIFSKDFDLAKWLGREFGKQSLSALTDDKIVEAERMIRMDVIGARKL